MSGFFSYLFQAILAVVISYGLFLYGQKLYEGETPTNLETFGSAILLTLLSMTVASRLTSIKESSESIVRIDAIATQSSTKLADQSTHIFEIERFLESILLEKTRSSESVSTTDIQALVQHLRTIRRNNTALMLDWTGVSSKPVSNSIQGIASKQVAIFDSIGQDDDDDDGDDRIASEFKRKSEGIPVSAVPSFRTPPGQKVVGQVTQRVADTASATHAKGTLTVEILRQAYGFTAGGKLSPQFSDIPKTARAKLLSHPIGLPSQHAVRSGAGTNFDFSIHLKSKEFGAMLPTGQYEFEYEIGS